MLIDVVELPFRYPYENLDSRSMQIVGSYYPDYDERYVMRGRNWHQQSLPNFRYRLIEPLYNGVTGHGVLERLVMTELPLRDAPDQELITVQLKQIVSGRCWTCRPIAPVERVIQQASNSMERRPIWWDDMIWRSDGRHNEVWEKMPKIVPVNEFAPCWDPYTDYHPSELVEQTTEWWPHLQPDVVPAVGTTIADHGKISNHRPLTSYWDLEALDEQAPVVVAFDDEKTEWRWLCVWLSCLPVSLVEMTIVSEPGSPWYIATVNRCEYDVTNMPSELMQRIRKNLLTMASSQIPWRTIANKVTNRQEGLATVQLLRTPLEEVWIDFIYHDGQGVTLFIDLVGYAAGTHGLVETTN